MIIFLNLRPLLKNIKILTSERDQMKNVMLMHHSVNAYCVFFMPNFSVGTDDTEVKDRP